MGGGEGGRGGEKEGQSIAINGWKRKENHRGEI